MTEAARKPLSFSDAPGRFAVTITPAQPERLVIIELDEGATWDDYARAVEEEARVQLGYGADEWTLVRHRRVEP